MASDHPDFKLLEVAARFNAADAQLRAEDAGTRPAGGEHIDLIQDDWFREARDLAKMPARTSQGLHAKALALQGLLRVLATDDDVHRMAASVARDVIGFQA